MVVVVVMSGDGDVWMREVQSKAKATAAAASFKFHVLKGLRHCTGRGDLKVQSQPV